MVNFTIPELYLNVKKKDKSTSCSELTLASNSNIHINYTKNFKKNLENWKMAWV